MSSGRIVSSAVSGILDATVRRVRLPAVPRAVTQWLGAIIVLCLVGSALWMLYPAFDQRVEQRRQMDGLRRELKQIRRNNSDLRYEIERLHSKTYVEEIARADLGLIKAGEIPYMVIPVEPKPQPKPKAGAKRLALAARAKGRANAKAKKPAGSRAVATATSPAPDPAPNPAPTQASMASAPNTKAKQPTGGLAGWWASVQAWLESLLE